MYGYSCSIARAKINIVLFTNITNVQIRVPCPLCDQSTRDLNHSFTVDSVVSYPGKGRNLSIAQTKNMQTRSPVVCIVMYGN